MDLVDIDQVLDNLELSVAADELSHHSAVASKPVQNTTAAAQPEGRILGDGACGAARSATKNFVGVSQVFNSLDDYRNNVKSLEQPTTQNYDWHQKIDDAEDVDDGDVNDADDDDDDGVTGVEEVEIEVPLQRPAIRNKNFGSVENAEDDEEVSASGDISKFNEAAEICNHLQENYVGIASDETSILTSDSLTTSSCSTFSSGPSPGNATNTDEPLSPVSSALDSDKQSAVEVIQIAVYEPKRVQTETSSVAASSDPIQNVATSLSECVTDEQNKAVVLDDLAAGLSSISINTTETQSMLPCEVTASSVLGRVLNELSESDVLSSDSQEQQQNSVTRDTKDEAASTAELNDTSEHSQHTEIESIEVQPVNAPVAIPKQIQQPITFCSTMDDISDTELDSMLQEMDIDDVADTTCNKATKDTTQELSQEDNKIPISPTADESVDVISEQETSQSIDQMNADNFSQASTIEFAEVKAQTVGTAVPTDQTVVAAEEELDKELASSYSSTDSDSLSGRRAVNEPLNADDAAEATQQLRPERPKTLDLVNVNTNLYGNAGQTPPGGMQEEETENASNTVVNLEDCQSNTNGECNESEQAESGEEVEDGNLELGGATGYSDPHANLGKVPPIWVPDNMASGCMQCQQKFTMIKRRHHCRACGKVLCSVCCSQRCKLEFLTEPESRVCVQCYLILTQRQHPQLPGNGEETVTQTLPPTPMRSPNPNNPMEYCSTIPPHRQVTANSGDPPPSVIVPVGVLKKEGSYSSNSSNSSSKKARKRKSVMFSDGIAPGSELASSLEQQWGEAKQARRGQQGDRNRGGHNKPPTPAASDARSLDNTTMGLVAQLFRGSIPPSAAAAAISAAQSGSEQTSNSKKESGDGAHNSPRRKATSAQRTKKLPPGCDQQGCFIPYEDNALPPICLSTRDDSLCDFDYKEVKNDFALIERLQRETLKFVVRNNFYVYVRIVNLNCCMNRTVINFTTSGMHHVGNDEIIILLEIKLPAKQEEFTAPGIPKDIFLHLHEIYCEAENGRPIAELAFTSPRSSNFLGSREYGGFIYIRPSYQCLQEVIMPENPYLVGVLIHRNEVPWAKVFPLRLILRLGAQYRYYPCPLISVPQRESVYAEIAQTIINFLADFRNYSYTLPAIRGMYIHMEDRQTTVLIPRNRQEDINKAINNASDHILAFAGNFSKTADGHLVCMQNTCNDERTELYTYSTQAINIQGQPRKVTGASFFVLNESLKSTSGLSGKCSIVEDGLMVQILPTKMEAVRNALRSQKDIDIMCGPLDANEQQTEIVSIKWVDNDRDFNIGVKSPIDDKSMEGVSSMRVHASFNYANVNYSIRLTDIYILKFDDWYNATPSTLATSSADITRISEQIARSASMALIPFLDLLAAAGIAKIGLRATLHQENVCYEAGARGDKLPPLYMNALDNHLIPTLHNESTGIEDSIILELVFYILNV